ncbi:unnamed protein product [Clonostachys rosea]|uniref:Zn(2)-C6 fungal-type domain-containing protein n=1 Tax=Bionectria ochroleuca TaxID=29856 RepID=A0ABY6ULQ9_BIOOC|nr:unnamed protein product [Clonostachys rosea]
MSLAEESTSNTNLANGPGSPPKHPAACGQCRLRKVKCNRVFPECGPCVRLGLSCPYARSTESLSPEPVELWDVTRSGTKRKRARRACKACRAVKAKCSGRSPCERCNSRGLACSNPGPDPSSTSGVGSIGQDTAIMAASPSSGFGSTVASHTSQWGPESLDKQRVRACLNTYFSSRSQWTGKFLHKALTLSDWNQGRLDPALLHALVAIGMMLSSPDPEQGKTARDLIEQAQQSVLLNPGQFSVTQLQVLLLVIRFRWNDGDLSSAWNLLSMAARLAFTMRLNHEYSGEAQPLTLELRRLLVWEIYSIDRYFSGGVEDLSVCPTSRMQLRLPCDDYSFEKGLPSRAGFLSSTHPEEVGSTNVYGYYLKLLALRDEVLRYTKRVRRNNENPEESHGELEDLQRRLDEWEKHLPEELKLSRSTLLLLVHSDDGSPFVILHTHWLQSQCDLYRFLIPGIREAVSRDCFERTPPDYISYCQEACLDRAIRLCDLWSEVFHLEPGEMIQDTFLCTSIFQVSQILLHLAHLLPIEGSRSIAALQGKLRDGLALADGLRQMHKRGDKCLSDAEQIINVLGQHRDLWPRSSSPEREQNSVHLPSRHTLMPRVEDEPSVQGSNAEPRPIDDASQQRRMGRITPTFTRQLGDLNQIASSDFAGRDGAMSIGQDMGMLWDPFDMQMEDYNYLIL